MSEHNLGIQIEVVPNSMLCSGNRTKTVKNQGTFQTLGWKHKVGGDRRGEISAVGTKCHTMTLLTFCLVEAGVLLIHSKRFFSAKSQNVRLDTEVGKECLWGGGQRQLRTIALDQQHSNFSTTGEAWIIYWLCRDWEEGAVSFWELPPSHATSPENSNIRVNKIFDWNFASLFLFIDIAHDSSSLRDLPK